MADKTIINPIAQQAPATVINREMDAIEAYNQENHIETPTETMPSEGTVLLGRYKITGRMEVSSGEADLFLCTYNNIQYVAKVYRRKAAIKADVIKALATINTPYVAKLYASGEHNGYPVEILPFYKNGTIQGSTYSEEDLIYTVIPNVNEGLHAIHAAGILHKDLKPSNLMLNDDDRTISIIDFGISSAVDLQSMLKVTRTGMTPEYSAPETFKGVFYSGSDYYSFGITLYELACGYSPYANKSADEIAQYTTLEKLPFPEQMSQRMKDLITALTYGDITNRDDKENPNRRWGYEEVRKWLKGEYQPIPGDASTANMNGKIAPFIFQGEEYSDVAALVTALAKNWEAGKKQLFRSELSTYFKTFNKEAAAKCLAAEEEAGRENGKDDIIFWRLLYQINTQLKGIYWKDRVYESLPALGREVLDQLWDENTELYPYYNSILANKLLSQYVLMIAPGNEKLKAAAKALEDSYDLEIVEGSNMIKTYFRMGYTLSGQKVYKLNGEKFTTPGEFANYMKNLLETSRKSFIDLCHQLMTYQGTIKDEQLEIWLTCLGKEKELEEWRTLMDS